jgi:lipopolysaccharide/colanic/teichoic acid biosynthesis glycosyltransferase
MRSQRLVVVSTMPGLQRRRLTHRGGVINLTTVSGCPPTISPPRGSPTFYFDPTDVPANVVEGQVDGVALVQQRIGQALALVLLAALSPLMVTLAWLVARDGGPATFAQYRVGCGGRLFLCLKFRTMRVDAERALREVLDRDPVLRAEWQRAQKLADDPRVTRFGKWLRRSSLDELPQLLNVLRGEMALVGPRPITVPELRRYGRARWHYLRSCPA